MPSPIWRSRTRKLRSRRDSAPAAAQRAPFMSLPELKKRQPHRAESPDVTAWRGAGETQSAVLAIVAAAVGLYFIKPILLPFVVSGIVAYVCTPLIDWLAARTRMPRVLFAVLLFLTLLGIVGAVAAVTGQRLITETGATLGELQGTLEQLLRGANDGEPIHLFGLTLDDQTVRTAFDRARDWFSQPDHMALFTGYGLMAVIGTFLTAVLSALALDNRRECGTRIVLAGAAKPPRTRGADLAAARPGAETLFSGRRRHCRLCDDSGLCRTRAHSRFASRAAACAPDRYCRNPAVHRLDRRGNHRRPRRPARRRAGS